MADTDSPSGGCELNRALVEGELEDFVRGERRCVFCRKTSAVLIEVTLTADQGRRLGVVGQRKVTALFAVCFGHGLLDDLHERLGRVIERQIRQKKAKLYDVGSREFDPADACRGHRPGAANDGGLTCPATRTGGATGSVRGPAPRRLGD